MEHEGRLSYNHICCILMGIGWLRKLIRRLGYNITQVELLGVMAFAKSILGYGLGTMALYQSIWSKNFRMFFIFIIYILHFFIYYFIKFNGEPVSNILIIQIIFIHSILCFFILWIIDQSIIKNGVSR